MSNAWEGIDLEEVETLQSYKQSHAEKLLDREAREKILEAYVKTEEFERLVKSIEIDMDMLKERVTDKLAEKVIKNFARENAWN